MVTASNAYPPLQALSIAARDSARRVGQRDKEQRAEGYQARRQAKPKTDQRKPRPKPPAPQSRKGAADPALVSRIRKQLQLPPDLDDAQAIARAWQILGMTGSGRLEQQAQDILRELKVRKDRATSAAKAYATAAE